MILWPRASRNSFQRTWNRRDGRKVAGSRKSSACLPTSAGIPKSCAPCRENCFNRRLRNTLPHRQICFETDS